MSLLSCWKILTKETWLCEEAWAGVHVCSCDIVFSDSLTEHSLRLIPLQHSKVASFVRDQNLSNVWTVEYALELLFIGGLIPEAVWLAHKLGDWKTSVSIGVAFQVFCKHGRNFVRYEFLKFTYLFCVCLGAHIWCLYGVRRTSCGSHFSPSTTRFRD